MSTENKTSVETASDSPVAHRRLVRRRRQKAELTDDQKVAKLLNEIEDEKKSDFPSKSRMRDLIAQIRYIKQDYRNTYTGQDNKWQLHTSMREWGYDA